MTVNSLGAEIVTDFGNPKVLTGKARANLSAGQLVFASGAAGLVTSGVDSYQFGDTEWATGASGAEFTGVVLVAGSSGTAVSVAVGGVFVLQAIGGVSGGMPVAAGGDDSVLWSQTAGHVVGRALTTANSGTFAVINIFG